MFDKSEEPPQGLHTTKKFSVEILGEDDISSFLKLQKKVWKSLAPDEKHFLKLRTRQHLLNHMSHRMPIIGIKDSDGKLVGQCLLSYPSNEGGVINIHGYPIKGKESTTAIIQSLAVDPDVRGQGLSSLLIDTAKDIAAMTGHVALLAKVASDNKKSTKSFLNAAFSLADSGSDPVKKYPVNYWQTCVYNGCTATPV